MSDQIAEWEARHEMLLRLCRGGDSRSVPVDKKKLNVAKSEREFCALCAMNRPENDFYLKLFQLKDDFLELAPEPPLADEAGKVPEDAEKSYLDECLRRLREKVADRDFNDIRKMSYESVIEFGTHFSTKLIHSSAESVALFAPKTETDLPHLSSRSLRCAGISLPLDQTKLDSSGVYQRILKVVNDDPIIHDDHAKLPMEIADAIRTGAEDAFRESADRQSVQVVDYRLRQVLLPFADDYLAVSPVPAGGKGELIQEAIETMGRIQDETAIKTENSTEKESKKKESLWRNWMQLDLPFGGANTQNISVISKNAIQRPLFFLVPQLNLDKRASVRFVYRPYSFHVKKDEIDAIVKNAVGIEKSSVLKNSVTEMAVSIQATGDLARLVRRIHAETLQFSLDLLESPFLEEGDEIPIDLDLLRKKRHAKLDDLDLAIVNRSFGPEYRESLAENLVDLLVRKSDNLGSQATRERLHKAIVRILEKIS